MPPVQKTGKDEIISAAFDIVKEKGFCNLNARAIAKKLGVSTQPIFSNFKNMEDLKMEIVRKASSFYKRHGLHQICQRRKESFQAAFHG